MPWRRFGRLLLRPAKNQEISVTRSTAVLITIKSSISRSIGSLGLGRIASLVKHLGIDPSRNRPGAAQPLCIVGVIASRPAAMISRAESCGRTWSMTAVPSFTVNEPGAASFSSS
jgi:hypothetical protein